MTKKNAKVKKPGSTSGRSAEMKGARAFYEGMLNLPLRDGTKAGQEKFDKSMEKLRRLARQLDAESPDTPSGETAAERDPDRNKITTHKSKPKNKKGPRK